MSYIYNVIIPLWLILLINKGEFLFKNNHRFIIIDIKGQWDRETKRQRENETEKQWDRETMRQRNNETEKQRDRETMKQKKTKRQRENVFWRTTLIKSILGQGLLRC